MTPLIDPVGLGRLLADRDAVRLLDVRWRLDRPDGRDAFRAGHLPGAVYVDLEAELSRHGDAAEGRHPLPPADALQDSARRWGVRQGDTVVVYDDWLSMGASRAWWMLDRAGVRDVRVLDGGLAAWRDAGFPLEEGEPAAPMRGDVALCVPASRDDVLDIDEAASWPGRGILIDARAPERYRGDVEPIDPVGGHIPGAVNLPGASLLSAGGRFRSADEIAAALDDVGATAGRSVAAYCGSGVTAAQLALAARIADRRIAVYPGSWSAWSNTPGRPVATGPER